MSKPYRERFFTCQDGLRLFFRDYGDPVSERTPVLCLGGLTRNSKDFAGVAARYAGTRRVLALDWRGRGRSAWDPDWRRYRPESYVGDIRDLLCVAGVEKVVVVGTSLGGVMGMVLGATMPTRVAGVVLNDVGPEIELDALAPVIAYMNDPRPMDTWEAAAERLRATFPGFPAETPEQWMAIARATYRQRDDGKLVFDWDPAIVRPPLGGGGGDFDMWPLYRALRRVPVLAIRGAESDILTAAAFERMAEGMPHLTRVTVPGVGHAPGLFEAEAVAAMDTFLGGIA